MSSCSPTRASELYSTLIETRRDLVEKNPIWCSVSSMLRRSAGPIISTATMPRRTRRIKRDNPEMTDELIAYSIAKMKEYGIVDSGDALKTASAR